MNFIYVAAEAGIFSLLYYFHKLAMSKTVKIYTEKVCVHQSRVKLKFETSQLNYFEVV